MPPMLSKVTRLQLGNIKTQYGQVSTAAGSSQKWGNLYGRDRYPWFDTFLVGILPLCVAYVLSIYNYYRHCKIYSEYITYEDVRDRCLTPVPGWARFRTSAMATPVGPTTFSDPTPLDWLPYELKLGVVKQSSY